MQASRSLLTTPRRTGPAGAPAPQRRERRKPSPHSSRSSSAEKKAPPRPGQMPKSSPHSSRSSSVEKKAPRSGQMSQASSRSSSVSKTETHLSEESATLRMWEELCKESCCSSNCPGPKVPHHCAKGHAWLKDSISVAYTSGLTKAVPPPRRASVPPPKKRTAVANVQVSDMSADRGWAPAPFSSAFAPDMASEVATLCEFVLAPVPEMTSAAAPPGLEVTTPEPVIESAPASATVPAPPVFAPKQTSAIPRRTGPAGASTLCARPSYRRSSRCGIERPGLPLNFTTGIMA